MQPSKTFELPARPRRMALSLAPLIDVTFILLIFFMLVTQFSQLVPVDARLGEISQSLPLDDAGAGRAAHSQLRLLANGGYDLDGQAVGGIDELARAVADRGRVLRQRIPQDEPIGLTVEPEGAVGLQQLIDALAVLQGVTAFAIQIALPADQREKQ